MQFSLTALMIACAWVAVLIASTTAVLRVPEGLSELPPLFVGLLSSASIAIAAIAAFTDGQTKRPFWFGYIIATICFVGFLLLHQPGGLNNITTFRPISDLLLEILKTSDSSWISFHFAKVLEYWSIPPSGWLGGKTATWFVSQNSRCN